MKKNNKHTISKYGFKTPKNYFTSFEDSVFEKLSNDNLLDTTNFKIPENYFETVEDNVFKKLNLKKSPKIISIRRILIGVSVAASLLFMFSIIFSGNGKINPNTIAINEIENWMDDNIENIDTHAIIENISIDAIDTLQIYDTNEIIDELEGVDIEQIIIEIETEIGSDLL